MAVACRWTMTARQSECIRGKLGAVVAAAVAVTMRRRMKVKVWKLMAAQHSPRAQS